MVSNHPDRKKVIPMTPRDAGRNGNGAGSHRPVPAPMRVITITSGKGGVGKTSIVANLGFALTRIGKRVVILDADLGLGNLDVLLGIAPKYNLSHVLTGQKLIEEVMVEGPGKIRILPASSGIQELTRLTREQKIEILTQLDRLSAATDILLIDTGAGISSNVMYFNAAAQEVLVAVAPEPTSITDAYALMKVLSLRYAVKHFQLIVNLAATVQEADEVYRQLSLVAGRFLDISIEYLGYVLFDEHVTKCVRQQKVVSELYPGTQASRSFGYLAKRLSKTAPMRPPREHSNFCWEALIRDGSE